MTGRLAIAFLAASVAALPSQAVRGAVKQLDGTSLPQPPPAAEISVVTSRGFPSSADTLAGLFHSFAGGVDGQLDPIADATTGPDTFDPRCGLQVSVVLSGGACKHALGWYNVTQPATTPAANQIFPVIPADLTGAFPNGIGCTSTDFCPLASGATGVYAQQYTWDDPLPVFDPQIASSPNWQGGRVGFALIGNALSMCAQTKYSQAELGPKSTGLGGNWVTALIYPSAARPGAVYLAFEDLPMCGQDWKCDGADGDFNDAVFFIAPRPCGDGGPVDAVASDASGRRDGSADGLPHRDAGANTSATGGVGGNAGQAGAAGSGAGGAPSSGGRGGPGGQTSATGGQTFATGGQAATGAAAGSAGGKPAGSGGGCGCQSADGSVAGLLRWLILVPLVGLRRRPKRAQITGP